MMMLPALAVAACGSSTSTTPTSAGTSTDGASGAASLATKSIPSLGTVLVNGQAVCSCLVLAVEMDGAQVTTIEGLAADGQLDPLQEAFVATGAVQCGFCIPGMIMEAKALLDRNPTPTRAQVQAALDEHLCRCGTHNRIIRAILRASKENHA